MQRDEILQRVKKVVSEVLETPPENIKEEHAFTKDLGAESIQSVELVAGFEEEFDIEMDEDEALQVQTVGDAVRFISKYVK
jgi:acyl carrier protein